MSKEGFKLIIALTYSVCIAFSWIDPLFLLPLLFLAFIHRTLLIKILKRLLLLNIFIGFLVLFVLFEDPQEALQLFLRTNMILLFNLFLFFESKGYDIVRGCYALKCNKKFVVVFYVTIALIEYLFKELKILKGTLKARGFHARTSLFAYQTYGNIFALMFIKVIRKSQQIQQSMTTRGFQGQIYLLDSKKMGWEEYALAGVVLSVIIIKGWGL